jgi:hypothetical protein
MSWERTQRSMAASTIGVGIGDMLYAVDAKAPSTDLFYSLLKKRGIRDSKIFTTFATAYAQMQDGENDTLIAYPGTYPSDVEINLTKDYCHIVGAGSPNVEGDYTQGGVNFYSGDAHVVRTFDLTGDFCQFHNIKVSNPSNHAESLGAFNIEGAGAYFKNVSFMGITAATPAATANAYSVCINRGGYFPLFEDCIIGSNTGTDRTGAAGHLYITNGGTGSYCPDNGIFRRCKFSSTGVTDTVPMVLIDLSSIDRIWLFDNCYFYNFYTGAGTQMAQVFDDNDTFYTHTIVLNNCVAHGYHEWADHDIAFLNVVGSMAASDNGGGLTKQLTDAVA